MSRIFNANVGDESVGNAGPDAIEQDLDNLFNNKADKTEVLTKDNTTAYIPTQDYNPATKKYTDTKATETLQTVNQSLSLINDAINGLNTDKANKDNVLELDNEIEYTPITDYNPVTKKYVDDEVDLLSERIDNHYTTGTYTGNGTNLDVALNYQPSMVVIQSDTTHTIIKGFDYKDSGTTIGQITLTGFTITGLLNTDTIIYNYIAFK